MEKIGRGGTRLSLDRHGATHRYNGVGLCTGSADPQHLTLTLARISAELWVKVRLGTGSS